MKTTINISREKILKLSKGIEALDGMATDRFGYTLAKNYNAIEPEIKAIRKADEPIYEVREYNRKVNKLKIAHADKDEKGNEIYVNGDYQITKDINAYLHDLNLLQVEYEQVLLKNEGKNKGVKELIEEEISIDLYIIKLSQIPKGIPYLNLLFPIIVDDTE